MMNLNNWEGFKKYDVLGANDNADFWVHLMPIGMTTQLCILCLQKFRGDRIFI